MEGTAATQTRDQRRRVKGLVGAILVILAQALLAFPERQAVAQTVVPPLLASAPAGDRLGFSSGNALLNDDAETLERDLRVIVASGARWVRLPFSRANIETAPADFRWEATDRVVAAATAHGLSVLGVVAYTPAWDRPAGTSWNHGPTDPTSFAAFARATAARYAPRGVHSWEVWNEPNIAQFWAPQPDAGAYARLLAATASSIRSVDGLAHVLVGGLVGVGDTPDQLKLSPSRFLRAVYDVSDHTSFDAVAVHPYSYPFVPMDGRQGDWNGFARLPALHDAMRAAGDGSKAIWITEFGAPTGVSKRAVSEAGQAAAITVALDAWQRWAWAGPIFLHSQRDKGVDKTDPEENFGLARHDFTPKPALAVVTTFARGAA